MFLYFWPIETSSRDYPYKWSLSKSLNEPGTIHVFARPWTLSYLTLFFRKINWVGQNFNHKLKPIRNKVSSWIVINGGTIFMFDEEGGFYYPAEYAEQVFKHRYKNLDSNEIACVFAWGVKQNNYLRQMGFKSTLVGHPRFDPNRLKPETNIKMPILIMTNFSLLFSEKDFSQEYDDTYFPLRISESKKDFAKLIQFISDTPNANYHVRIHPSESLELYNKLFKNYKNVKILPREPLLDAIDRSAKVLHFNCTTALDSFSRGKNTKNLSGGESTIIDDIPENINESLNSKWLKYPADTNKIVRIIKMRSQAIDTRFTLIKIKILIWLFECLYQFRIIIVGDYEVQKFGKMKTLASGKNYVIKKY